MKVVIFALCLIVSLSGCVVGFGVASEPGPPEIEYWIKPDTSAEQRVQDSKECGGSPLGANFSRKQLEAEGQPGEHIFLGPLSRLHDKWERCMLSKGYRYTGQCLDNSVSRSSPACGAP
ncbi:hypothetical protein [Thiopseudomonas acetoxidans]|uniref:Lipoprotein n=1 Tax=Thiopseudomonas acetoxidans TaxID=3041622 RepID=A0ABT7SMM5_9GAMM|nr:hypothetical protein [Thiopseudomonas sp. CY1220]MDM7857441.1 hypothetical protein [Thiopseudomonas sp. CY1220]